jgi:outer membrane protein assembly factor BamE (lipoprotein component of BamABCDE complex)|tara:strand:- start:1843 stop:2307 length:465 start_codon:yes stop_codon:yes gene_type:complete
MSFINFILIILFIFTVNCSGNKVSNFHGSKSLDDKFNKIKPNYTNKNDIIKIIGPPSSISDFDKNKWFYIERLKTNQSLLKLGSQKIQKNNILIVTFNKSGMLQSKKLLDLNNMNDIKFLEKTTQKDFQKNNIVYEIFSSMREKINAPSKNRSK